MGTSKNRDGLAITESDLRVQIAEKKYRDNLFEIIIDEDTAKLEWFIGFMHSDELNYDNWKEKFTSGKWLDAIKDRVLEILGEETFLEMTTEIDIPIPLLSVDAWDLIPIPIQRGIIEGLGGFELPDA